MSNSNNSNRALTQLHQQFESIFYHPISESESPFQVMYQYYLSKNRKNINTNKENQFTTLLQTHLPYLQITTSSNMNSMNTSRFSLNRRSSVSQPSRMALNEFISRRKKYMIYHRTNPNTGEEINFTLPLSFQTIVSSQDPQITDEIRTFLLLFIGILRLYYVDKLIDIITRKFYSCKTNLKGFNMKCNVVAVGSTALTSNYDVTVSGILFPQKIVAEFNRIFIDFWGDYSSVVFDTNLYGSTFFVTTPQEYKVPPHVPLLFNQVETTPPLQQNVYYLPPKYVSEDIIRNRVYRDQITWLPIKFLFHSHEYHFDQHSLYHTYMGRISEIVENLMGMESKLDLDIDEILEEKGLTAPDQLVGEENLPTKIRLYEETQLDVRANLEKYELIGINLVHSNSPNRKPLFTNHQSPEGKALTDSLCELIESISRNNYYGMETYYCMGTIYHVLGFIQNLAPFEMRPEYFQISALENFIDLFRYAHYFESPETIDKAVIKMSKYAYRIYDALFQLKKDISSISPQRDIWGNILRGFKGKTSLGNTRNQTLSSISGTSSIEGILEKIWNDIVSTFNQKSRNVNLS